MGLRLNASTGPGAPGDDGDPADPEGGDHAVIDHERITVKSHDHVHSSYLGGTHRHAHSHLDSASHAPDGVLHVHDPVASGIAAKVRATAAPALSDDQITKLYTVQTADRIVPGAGQRRPGRRTPRAFSTFHRVVYLAGPGIEGNPLAELAAPSFRAAGSPALSPGQPGAGWRRGNPHPAPEHHTRHHRPSGTVKPLGQSSWGVVGSWGRESRAPGNGYRYQFGPTAPAGIKTTSNRRCGRGGACYRAGHGRTSARPEGMNRPPVPGHPLDCLASSPSLSRPRSFRMAPRSKEVRSTRRVQPQSIFA